MELSNIKLLSPEELLKAIEVDEVKNYTQNEIDFWSQNDPTQMARSWLQFCKSRSKTVKVQEYDIPGLIVPKHVNIALSDMKVSLKVIL